MALQFGRSVLTIGMAAYLVGVVPVGSPAQAQYRDNRRADVSSAVPWGQPNCNNQNGRDRMRCERERDRWAEERRKQDRKRRDDKTATAVVAGVAGAVVIGSIAAAIASSNEKKKRERARREYCLDRYGNYDDRTDSYRASDGRRYSCE